MELKIGGKIAKYRKLKGYTQEQFGELVGVSGQAVSKWENEAFPILICYRLSPRF